MIKNIKAVAADIDMTLTAKGGDLPEITKKAFDVLHENGVLIGLATGRELNDRLYNQGAEWKLDYPLDFLIGMNGGMLWDRVHGNVWTMDLMSTDTMKEILTFMKPIIDEYEVSVNVEGGGNHAAMHIKGELFASMKRRGWKFDDFTGDIEGFCSKPCYKFLFRTTPDVEKLIREKFTPVYSDRFQIISTFPGTVEIMDKNVSKGTGLAKICDANGISLSEVIAFGDNENDNPLLESAGWGVCLLNGSEGTKAIADDITELDCEAGGAGQYLVEKYLKPNGLWKD
ncbi:MAG: HAD-IIB family hydrolase [Erysipelotrichaceae bacterium]|nr:HAD-IIB family hydrolase [Erysipelotrichaceae bacterium]